MKKFLTTLSVMALLVCALTLCVSAAGSESNEYGTVTTIEGVNEPTVIDNTSRVVLLANDGTYYTYPSYYILKDQEVLSWKGGNDLPADLVSTLGYGSIGTNAIRTYIIRMEVPEGITGINPKNNGGAYAFEDAKKMVEFTWPSTLTRIGNYAFQRCYELANIVNFTENFKNVTQLGEMMFNQTAWGQGIDLVIPDAITSIPGQCFQGTKISSVTLPKNLEVIGGRCFQSCVNITSVTIPSTVTALKNHVFAACSNLAEVKGLENCNITEIGEYCFEKTKLKSFDFTDIADTLEKIGNGLFNNCNQLRNVTGFGLLNITGVGENMFNLCPLDNIEIPLNVTYIGARAYQGHQSKQAEIRIPNSVTSIGDHAFARPSGAAGGAAGLKIYLPASLETIAGVYHFEYWHFEEMYIPAGVSIPQGFVNQIKQTGVTYYYTGAKDTLTVNSSNNPALLNAVWVTLDEYNAIEDKSTANYIVYNYNHCDAFYDGEHDVASEEMHFVDYFTDITYVGNCSRAKCGKENVVNAEKTIGAIFASLGFSYTENAIGGSYSVSQGFVVNMENLAKYENVANVTLDFGVVASAHKANQDGTYSAISPFEQEKYVSYSFKNATGLKAFEIKVSGITEELVGTKLVMCAYVNNGSGVVYLNDEGQSTAVVGSSYNDVSISK